jgi:hypothetical protein
MKPRRNEEAQAHIGLSSHMNKKRNYEYFAAANGNTGMYVVQENVCKEAIVTDFLFNVSGLCCLTEQNVKDIKPHSHNWYN